MGVKLDKDLMADFNSNLNIFLFLNLDWYHMYGFLVWDGHGLYSYFQYQWRERHW